MAFTNAIDAIRFALSGKATLTMESERTGAHYTFKIERNAKSRPDAATYFVSLLMGPNNEADYSYIGMLRPIGNDKLDFSTTAGSKLAGDSKPVRSFRWIWRNLAIGDRLPPECVIRHNGRCGRCGRELTTPTSIDNGIGPECARLMGIGPKRVKRRPKSADIAPLRRPAAETMPQWLA